jgi:phage N-6-adenine-methyltransferase
MKLVSHEKRAKGSRDDWCTPRELFETLDRYYDFDIDLAANGENRLLKTYLGPGGSEEDALASDWSRWGSVGFCNPPYSRWADFALSALSHASLTKFKTVMLIPPRTDTRAFHSWLTQASELVFISGRISFELYGVAHKNNGTGSMLAVFEPPAPWNQTQRVSYWNPRGEDE